MSDNIKIIGVRTTHSSQLIDITKEVTDALDVSAKENGICCVYVPHTTAGVTINENADPDVKGDILMGLQNIVSNKLNYQHAEGNSPAHIKASLMGSSVNVIVENGKLVLGTWQGIYFAEFDGPRTRKVYVKIISG